MEEKKELHQLIDRLNNLERTLKLPLPDDLHVRCLRRSMPGLVAAFKKAYIEKTGENPWE